MAHIVINKGQHESQMQLSQKHELRHTQRISIVNIYLLMLVFTANIHRIKHFFLGNIVIYEA